MAQIGCLGEIIFEVSSEQIRTFSNMQWSGSVRYGVHDRHLNNAFTEFTGIEPDEISFDMSLSSSLGISPMEEIVKLWTYERNGQTLPLIIGEKAYGKYRWCIKNHTVKMETYDKLGNLDGATVSVDLLEYLLE